MAALYAMAFALFIYVLSPDFIETYIELAIEDLESKEGILTENIDKDPEEFMAEQIENVKSITRSQIVLDVFLKGSSLAFSLLQ